MEVCPEKSKIVELLVEDGKQVVKKISPFNPDEIKFLESVRDHCNYFGVPCLEGYEKLPEGKVVLKYSFQEGNPLNYDRLLGMSETDRIRIARTTYYNLKRIVDVMHATGFVHRDIKPENIIVSESFYSPDETDTPNFRLIDFGFATSRENFKQTRVYGTVRYMPDYLIAFRFDPEFRTHFKFDDLISGDIFAIGVVIYYLIYGEDPRKKLKAQFAVIKTLKKLVPDSIDVKDDEYFEFFNKILKEQNLPEKL